MEHLLFKVAEMEERLLSMRSSHCEMERHEAFKKLSLLEGFKYRPIRSFEESQHVLWEFNHIFYG